jgi:hypothetical protein
VRLLSAVAVVVGAAAAPAQVFPGFQAVEVAEVSEAVAHAAAVAWLLSAVLHLAEEVKPSATACSFR